MRLAKFKGPKDLAKTFSKEVSLELFRRICLCRNFELNVKRAISGKKIPRIFTYLSLGQESATSAISLSFPDTMTWPSFVPRFGQHRCHDLYLCYGASPEKLRDELLGLPIGCAGGMGGSASIHSPETGMFGHDGHMGTQVKIGVGYSLGSGLKTLIVMGDASAEEGYVLGALGEAASKKAPTLFVCMDNNLSILTEVKVRRSWTMSDEAKAKGMPAYDVPDDPWFIMDCVTKLKDKLPAFLNIHYCRELWHEGPGCDGPPEWNRYELVKTQLIFLGLKSEVEMIENSTAHYIENLWEDVLSPIKERV